MTFTVVGTTEGAGKVPGVTTNAFKRLHKRGSGVPVRNEVMHAAFTDGAKTALAWKIASHYAPDDSAEIHGKQ